MVKAEAQIKVNPPKILLILQSLQNVGLEAVLAEAEVWDEPLQPQFLGC